MTPSQAAEILRRHNEWRRFDGEPLDEDQPEMINPMLIGQAIDVAVAFINERKDNEHTDN